MTQIQNFMQVLKNEVGYLEKKSNAQLDDKTANAGSGNWTKFGRDYDMLVYGKTPVLNGQAWCATFITMCARNAGIPASVIPAHASCTVGINWFNNAGQWEYSSSGYVPKEGDIIYFSDGTGAPAHVGAVIKAEGGRVYTIEGNTNAGTQVVSNGGGVCEKDYKLSLSRILGYGKPNYFKEEEDSLFTYEEFLKYREREEAAIANLPPAEWSDINGERTWAEMTKIVTGDENGNKKYKKYITREEAVVMLHRLYMLIGKEKDED